MCQKIWLTDESFLVFFLKAYYRGCICMRSFSVYSNDSNRFFFSIHLTEIFSYDTVIMGEYKRMYEIESKHISKDIWISINKRSLP
jgi:hypothetical protein